MPSGTSSGATTGAANVSKRKRASTAKKLVRKGAGATGATGHRMDREINTPRPGGWANRTHCA